MDNRLISAGCCGLLTMGWGALVMTGHADAAPLINFLQMAAYTSLGLAAHGFVTQGSNNAKTDSIDVSSGIANGVRLPAINREPPAVSTADPAEPG